MPVFFERLNWNRCIECRLLMGSLVSISVLLFGLGFVAMYDQSPLNRNELPLRVDAPVKSIGNAALGTKFSVAFAISNRSDRPIRLVGATSICGAHCCLDVEDLPLDIAPRRMHEVLVSVEAKVKGHFANDLTLFSDAPGQARTVLTVKGEITDAANIY